MWIKTLTAVVALGTAASVDGHAQVPGRGDAASAEGSAADAYADSTAARLVAAARDRRLGVDRSLLTYTATVRERIAVGIRTFRKDRTIYRRETASRVRWSRDEPLVVQVLAGRQEHPGGVEPTGESGAAVDALYDPERDPIFFGLVGPDDEHELFIEHPLHEGSEAFYRYRSGDTLTISLPDGRALRAIEVQVTPREPSVKLITGSLWIEPETGGLMRAAYRLAQNLDVERDWDFIEEESDYDPDIDEARTNVGRVPGIFRPIQFELRMVVVDYSLWNFRYWLPRLLRAEGEARAGVVRAPAAFEISYDIEDAIGEGDRALLTESAAETLEGWRSEGDYRQRTRRQDGRRVRVLVPWEEEELIDSPHLPPPVWEEIGPSLSEAELGNLFDNLSDVAGAGLADPRWHLRWGYQEKDLLRYNRVESLSVGARVAKDFGFLEAGLTGRLATAAPTPDVRLELTRDRPDRRLRLAAYRTLTSVDGQDRALGPGNSASALVLGRDEGEYYRSAGASLALLPSTTERAWYGVRAFWERQRPVDSETDIALPGLWNDRVFRPNIRANPAEQLGVSVRLTPWWGADRSAVQGGLDVEVLGATGDFDYLRSRAQLSMVVPMGTRYHLGLEAAGGTAWGKVSVQREFYLGGGSTLRGYDGSVMHGTSFARGRIGVSKGIQAWGIVLFGDWGWAGDRADLRLDRGLYSVGLGLTTLDGLLRVDLARGLASPTGWRLELFLDSLL